MDINEIIIARVAAERRIQEVLDDLQKKTGCPVSYVNVQTSGDAWDPEPSSIQVMPQAIVSVSIQMRLP